MSDRRSPETYEELFRAFTDLFNETEPEDPEEVNALLREAGYDPDEVAARMQAIAEQALASSPLNWRNRARQQLSEAAAQFENFVPTPRGSRSEIMAAIKQIIAQLGGPQSQPVAAHFRNFEEASDEDLASLLSDLEYLVGQRRRQYDDSK
jgi:hypothetical protein